MFSVAIIGPDGSGKSLISGKLVNQHLDLRLKRMYMGINLESSNFVLPHTWLLLKIKKARGGRPDMSGPYNPSKAKPRSKNPVKRFVSETKGWLAVFNKMAEEWYRQLGVWYYQARGFNVLFDRHFTLDYYFHDMQYQDKSKPRSRRFHGWVLSKFYPRPDLIIFLDAPAEVLFARKGEGTVELLEQYRRDYLSLRDVWPAFAVIDATQTVDVVVQQAAETIRAYSKARAKGEPFRPAAGVYPPRQQAG